MKSIDHIIHINKAVYIYFRNRLQKSTIAKEYLYDRIDKEIAEEFKIGFAPSSGLIKWLKKSNISLEDARLLGLIAGDEDEPYEVFRDRIMFPIVHAGVIVGFGGRTIRNSKKKYINSKSSTIFNKSEVLYGLWNNRKAIAKKGFSVITEGYFDLLKLCSINVRNCIATCGTSLSEKHAKALYRWSDTALILYDGDEAGRKAAKKVKVILGNNRIITKVLKLPDCDPDEFINEYGGSKMKRLIDKSMT